MCFNFYISTICLIFSLLLQMTNMETYCINMKNVLLNGKLFFMCLCYVYLIPWLIFSYRFNSGSFVRMLNFIYTIETINNSSFLPGVRLGYHICDTCCHASKAIQSTEHLLALNNTEPGRCGLIQTPRVKAIIGARYSEVSISVARLLSLYMVPQVRYTV